MVYLQQASLPEFVNNQHIDVIVCHVFNSPSRRYDVILGQDFLQSIKMDIRYSLNTIKWLGENINMKDIQYFETLETKNVVDTGLNQ